MWVVPGSGKSQLQAVSHVLPLRLLLLAESYNRVFAVDHGRALDGIDIEEFQ